MFDTGYIYMLIGMVGTSIAPWMQFYLQSAVVEKGITAKEYAQSRFEVDRGLHYDRRGGVLHHRGLRGSDLVVTGRAIFKTPPTRRVALKPFGQYAFLLVQRGTVQRVVFRGLHSAACRPSTRCARAWASNRAWTSGSTRRPIFYWLYTLLIVVGAGVILWPQFPAGEDDPVFAGAERRAAALRADLHGAVDQPARA